ncbi:adenosine monophosphate-protein transferase [Pelomyxa schiedti]|nr:adenosine monophosphate-protein transferase [Pelomyxa schiedti]
MLTVEDVYEVIVQSGISIKFGVAFCEASGVRLLRWDGNDQECIEAAKRNAMCVGAGHSFFIFLKQGYPINILNQLKSVPEVCRIFCATSNPVQVIVAKTAQGRGIMGVIDGESPLGVETEADQDERKAFLRKIGYKH